MTPTESPVRVESVVATVVFRLRQPDGREVLREQPIALKRPQEALLDPLAFASAYELIAILRARLVEQLTPPPPVPPLARLRAAGRRLLRRPV